MTLEELIAKNTEAMKENTAAQAEHTALLQKMFDSRGAGSAGETGDGDKTTTRRPRRTNAQIEADRKAEEEAKRGGDGKEDTRRSRRDDGDKGGDKGDARADFMRDIKAFLDFGGDTADDEKERNLREDFVLDMNKLFKVDKIGEVDVKNYKKILRWVKLFAAGNEVDFEND